MSKVLRAIFITVSSLGIIGCAMQPMQPIQAYGGTFMWDGPGSYQDFATVRYQCAQETSARVSGAAVSQYGGVSGSSVRPSCSTFHACLASRGYFKNTLGRFDASSIAIACQP